MFSISVVSRECYPFPDPTPVCHTVVHVSTCHRSPVGVDEKQDNFEDVSQDSAVEGGTTAPSDDEGDFVDLTDDETDDDRANRRGRGASPMQWDLDVHANEDNISVSIDFCL